MDKCDEWNRIGQDWDGKLSGCWKGVRIWWGVEGRQRGRLAKQKRGGGLR